MEIFLKLLGLLGSTLAGSVIGAVITYVFTRRRDKKIDEKNRTDELNAMCNIIAFQLALQISELTNLKFNIQDRKKHIDLLKMQSHDVNLTIIFQDFPIYKNLNINMESAAKVILSSSKSHRDVPGALQSIFLSNKKYFYVIEVLERYHEVKRAIFSEKKNFFDKYLPFLERQLPEAEEIIEKSLEFAKQTFDGFETVSEKWGAKLNIALSKEVVRH